MTKPKNLLILGGTVRDFIIYTSSKNLTFQNGSKNPLALREEAVGGGGANSALAAAVLGSAFTPVVSDFGYPPQINVLLGSLVGHKSASLIARQEFSIGGVTLIDGYESQKSHSINTNIISIDENGERYCQPTTETFSPPPVDNSFMDRLYEATEQADRVHIHTTEAQVAQMGAEIAAELGKPYSVDASRGSKVLDNILPGATYGILADDTFGKETPAEEVLEYIKSFGVPYSAVMCGEHPTLYSINQSETQQIPVRKGSEFKVVDKNGAGDTARAAFCIALMHGFSFEESLDYAQAIATFSCAYKGREWAGAIQNPMNLYLVTGYTGAKPNQVEQTQSGSEHPANSHSSPSPAAMQ